MNVNAPIFVPSDLLIQKMQREKKISREINFDRLEDEWWSNNKDMFEDTFESLHKALKGGLIPYEEASGDRIFVKKYFIVGLSSVFE